MASLNRLFHAILLLPLLLLLAGAQSDVTLSKLESQSTINGLTISLQCMSRLGTQGNRTYFRELNGQVERVVQEASSDNSPLLTFVLTPSLEGFYFCRVGNVTSNKLELVAYPILNKTLSVANLPLRPLGGTVTVPCAYPRGAFEERYEVTWYRGVHEVDTSTTEFSRYEVLRNFSLVIHDMKPVDASNAYYCQVRVNLTNNFVVRQAPFLSVEVIDTLNITQGPREQIVAPNTVVQYICKVSGVPRPTVKWTFNGAEIKEGTNARIENNTTTLRGGVIVTSRLIYQSSQTSGQVACVGYHIENERVVVVTAEAHLVVLTDQLVPRLTGTKDGPRLNVQFPSEIPGEFDLVAEYYSRERNAYSFRVISHPSFRNTRVVDIAIPANMLPQFVTFSVEVALSVANMTGEWSTMSNEITFNGEFPPSTVTDMECRCEETDGTQAASPNSSVQALLAVFIVLLVILIAVGVFAGVMFYVCYTKMKSIPLDKLEGDQVSNGDGGHFSVASDLAKRPYSFEPPASPVSTLQRSKKGSFSSRGSRAEGSDDDDDANGNDDIGHKKLKQWDEDNKAGAGPGAIGVGNDMEIEQETGIVMHSNEPHPARVQHRKRGGGEPAFVTNIAMHNFGRREPLAAVRPVNESFEDLSFDAEMLKTNSA